MSSADLKENLLAARVEKALRWGIERRTPILLTTGALIVAGLISSVVVLRRNQARETVETQIAIAQSLVMQQRPDQAISILQTARANAVSRALLARLLYVEGTANLALRKFAEAEVSFRDAVTPSAGSPLQPLILSNLAYAQEEKKDFESAAATCGRFMTDYGNHYLAPRIQLALGRTLFAAGKADDARKALNQLIDLYPASVWAQSARQIMGRYK